MIDKCIQAPDSLKWDIVYCVSNNQWRFRDIQHARESVGYVPQDRAEDYRER